MNGPEDPRLPGSDRVRNALAAAVSRGTPGAVMTAGAVDGALSSDGEQMPPQPPVPESQVVVPDAPLAPTGDTPIGRAAEAAVGVRGAGREDWPRPSRCRIMTVANQKGGVGKTTTAVNLAASLSQHGIRVLVVDLDPQGNASTALNVDHHVGRASIYNALVDERPLGEIIAEVPEMPGLFCAPATIDLAGAEIELVPMVAREGRLSRAIDQLDTSNFDYVLIDCPPSLGLLTVNALVAAEEVLIPIQCEYYALEGLEQLLRTVELVRAHLNSKLRSPRSCSPCTTAAPGSPPRSPTTSASTSTTSSCTRSSPARSASPRLLATASPSSPTTPPRPERSPTPKQPANSPTGPSLREICRVGRGRLGSRPRSLIHGSAQVRRPALGRPGPARRRHRPERRPVGYASRH